MNLSKNKYLLLSVHREENLENKKNFEKLINLLKYLNKKPNEKVLLSTHPRTMNKLKEEFLKNFKYYFS